MMISHNKSVFVAMVLCIWMLLIGFSLGCSRSSHNTSRNNNATDSNNTELNDTSNTNINNIVNTSPEITTESLERERVNVRFHLYSTPQEEHMFTNSIAHQTLMGKYNSRLKTVIIIHGYLEHGNRSWIVTMVEELFRKERTNVIVVDWYRGATNLNYFRSADNTQIVGEAVAQLMNELRFLGADPLTFHIIGYSLGAHAAGYAGSLFDGVGRITGLDPARVAFENAPESIRLDPSDAVFVDVLHSDGEPGIGMGTMQPMGHLDFYLNGGMKQPGCPTGVLDRVWEMASKFDFTADSLKRVVTCSHARANQLFSSSINNDCQRRQQRCSTLEDLYENYCVQCTFDSCPRVGYNTGPTTPPRTQQLYIVHTSSEWPFCCEYIT